MNYEDVSDYDMVIVGAGPGGYVAALRASQLGLHVACVDENHNFGGTCLRIGCIPSKALLESSEYYEQAQRRLAEHGVKAADIELDLTAMMGRKDRIVAELTQGVDSLLRSNKVTSFRGRARLLGNGKILVEETSKGGETTAKSSASQTLQAPHILLATGSRPATLPDVAMDGSRIGSSCQALCYDLIPKRLIVIGAGYIGLELGSVWRRLGSEVIVVEAAERILPGMDDEIAESAHTLFEKQGLKFHLDSLVKSAKVSGDVCRVKLSTGQTLKSDRVLVAVGRVPHTKGLGLEQAGVACDENGRIQVDERFATSVEGIYAIGDCIAGPMLAHKASEEGIACVERIVTGHGSVNYDVIPAVVYTHPEIATVGKSEQELQRENRPYHIGRFPFAANGRARTLGETDGFVKMLADKQTDRILGVHILGLRAGDLIAEAAAAMEFGASSEDLARCCHAHPTLAEALHEAALAVDGRALHGK